MSWILGNRTPIWKFFRYCKTTGVVVAGGLDPGPTGGTYEASDFIVENQKKLDSTVNIWQPKMKTGWWFLTFYMFTSIWGRFPF